MFVFRYKKHYAALVFWLARFLDSGPDGTDSVRAWVAPKSGTVTVTADGDAVTVTNGPGADGVKVKLLKGTMNVWPLSGYQMISPGTSAAFAPVNVTVAKGDTLYFHVNQNGNNAYDTTNWLPRIMYQ